MVPVTYLFVVLFGGGTRANEFAFAAWHHSARSTIYLEGTARTSRDDVLLCEWGESATKFTMNVSIKTSCFRSTRLLLSQVVDREGRIEAPPPFAAAFMYIFRLTGGSISGLLRKRATANPFTQASCYSRSSKGNTSTIVKQKIRSVPHFFQPPAIGIEPESNAKMMKIKGVTRWRELEGTYCVTSISARNTSTWAFFSNTVFNHFPLEDFLKPTGID